MTVADTPRKAGPFYGNGINTSFPFDFKVFAKTDIRVVITNPDTGAATDAILDSDYSVLVNVDQDAQPGGTVSYPILGSPLALNYSLTIIGGLPIDQRTDITNVGRFNPDVIERSLDRATIQMQQMEEVLNRTLQAAVGTTVKLQFPAPSSGQFIRWRDDKTGLENGFLSGSDVISYKLPALTSVERTQASKLAESVSVKDFGAIGNGLTDDTIALQAAIDYAANLSPGGTASGCVLHVPPGEYGITSSLIMPANKPIIFQGEGDGSKLKRLSGAGPLIECRSSSTIRSIFFKGPVAGTSNGIYCNGANTARIENCYFQNQVTGVQLTSSYAVELVSNIFDVCYTYGIATTTSAHNTVVERCNFFTCGVLNGGQAIRIGVASDNIVIQDNDFEFCNVNFTLVGCNSVQITGNYMEYQKAACFDFGAGCSGVIIESNWIALGDAVGGGNVAVIQNITGGRFAHNTIFDQSVTFVANALVGFDVWLNTKTGSGTVGGAPWSGPVLLNSWAQQANHTTAGFLKDSRGWVHLRGGFVGGVAPAVLFNLPAGYRPANIAVFGTESASGACRITVNPNGDVVPTVAASNNACIDGISFYVG